MIVIFIIAALVLLYGFYETYRDIKTLRQLNSDYEEELSKVAIDDYKSKTEVYNKYLQKFEDVRKRFK